MLNNTYDASGIHFGILVSPQFHINDDSDFSSTNKDLISSAISAAVKKTEAILNFEYVDGLTLNDVLSHERFNYKNTILFVSYTMQEYVFEYNNIRKFEKDTNILTTLVITRKPNNCNNRIDKEIEDSILNKFENFCEKEKRVYRCFLERHRYGSKEKTDAKIKEYTKK